MLNAVTSHGHCAGDIGQRPSLNCSYRVSKLVEVKEEKFSEFSIPQKKYNR
jgi:hypothetical protein